MIATKKMGYPCPDTFYYLATVYSSYPTGMQDGFAHAAGLTGELLKRGIHVFSPITHGHPASVQASIPETYEFWITLDKKYIDRCDKILVATMPNWNISKGIGMEIDYANEKGMPVEYLCLRSLRLFESREHAEKATL